MHRTYKHYTFLVLHHVIAVLQTCLTLRILASTCSPERQDAIDVEVLIGTTHHDHNVGMKETIVPCHFVAEGLAQFQQSFRGTVQVQIVDNAVLLW